MRYRLQSGLLVSLAFILAACGGSGSSGGTPVSLLPPPFTNSAPVFSSAASVMVPENTLTDFYTVTAADADGDAVNITITGGADIEQFEFTSTGTLSFKTPPNFENPTDSNGDNVYDVEFTATDGNGGSAVLSLSVTVTDEADEKVRNKDVTFNRADISTNVLFHTVGTTELRMDIFTPRGDTATDRPVIIFAFGGGFVEGDRTQVAFLAANFALRGYVAASIDYRLFENGTPNDNELLAASIEATQDLYAAVRFFRADGEGANTYGVNPDRIFVGGVSAGGVMAASAAILDENDEAVRNTLAPLLEDGGLYGDDATERESAVQGALSISGATLSLDAIDADSAVLFAAHEEFDPVVPCGTDGEGSSSTGLVVSGGCVMVPAYEAVGAPAELYLIESVAAHVGYTPGQFLDILQGAADLFYANVISQE